MLRNSRQYIIESKQRGFGALAVIVAVAVITALGLVGWKIYDANSKPKQAASDQSSTSESTPTAQKPVESKAEQAGTNELKIPELGIKIRLTDETKDLKAKVFSPITVGFSLQSFIDATAKADTVRDNDGTSACLSRVSVGLYKPEEREQLENDPIQSYKFDADGKPLDEQWLVQLADKRYARFSAYQATCIKDGENAEMLRSREGEIKGILLKSLSENISSL